MRTAFEIVPRVEVIEQIDKAIKKPFGCAKCLCKVKVSEIGEPSGQKYLLVPKLKVGQDPKGAISFTVFCETCGRGLMAAIHAFMTTATMQSSIVRKCGDVAEGEEER